MTKTTQETLSVNEYAILNTLSRNDSSTVYYLQNETGIDQTTIKHWLKKLISKHLILEKQNAKRTYSLNPENAVFRKDIALFKISGKILIFADENSDIGRLFEEGV